MRPYQTWVGTHSTASQISSLAISSVVQITSQYAGTPYEVTLPRVPWLREKLLEHAKRAASRLDRIPWQTGAV